MRKTEITTLKSNYIVYWKERRGAHLDKLILCPLKLCITKDSKIQGHHARWPLTLKPVSVKIEITTLHFSVKDKTCQHTPFSFTVRLISSSRMRVIFIFCGSSPGNLQNLKEIILCDSNWMSTMKWTEMFPEVETIFEKYLHQPCKIWQPRSHVFQT